MLASVPSVPAATFIWDGGAANNSWGAAGNWNPNTAPTFDNTADIIFHEPGAARLSNFIGNSRTIRSLSFNTNVSTGITIRTSTTDAGTTGSILTFDGGGSGATLSSDALYDNASNLNIGVTASNGSITLADNLAINFNNAGAGNLTLSVPINESGGARSITSSGTGLVVFSGVTNNFTGGLIINGGTVRDAASTQFNGSTKNVTLGGGTLEFTRAYSGNQSVAGIELATTAATSSTLVYNDTGSGGANLTMGGTAALAGNLHVNNTSSAGGADVVVWNLATTGNGTLSYSGDNQDVLNNINNQRFQVNNQLAGFGGDIEIRKGVWLANGASSLGSGTINIGVTASADNAAVTLNANSATSIANAVNVRSGAGVRLIQNTTANARTFTGTATLNGALTYKSDEADTFSAASTITGSGGLTKLGVGQLTLSGTNSGFSGDITVSEGSVRALNASLGSGSVSVASGADLTLRQTSGSRAFANAISGAGTLTVSGGQLIALSGANTLTGNITLADANTTLRIDNTAFNSSTANIDIVASTGLLRLNANAADQTIANDISGAGGVVKQGNLQTTLTGANTYSGTTTVSAGALQVGSGGTGQTGTGAVTVSTGSVILGSGVVRGEAFTAESGATVHVGDNTSAGEIKTLTFTPVSGSGSFDFQSGSSVILGLNPGAGQNADLLSFNGTGTNTLLFNGNLTVGPSSLVPTATEVFNLLDWSSLSSAPTFAAHFTGTTLFGNGDEAAGLDLPDIFGTGYVWDISSFTTNGTIAIVLVPEPSRMMLLLFAVVAIAARRRRV